MRSLMGGIVAAIIATAVWLCLEHTSQREFGWFMVVIGLATGFGVRGWGVRGWGVKGRGTGSSGIYAKGALAVILALGAILGGRLAYSKILEQMVRRVESVEQTSLAVDAKVKDSEDDTGSAEVAIHEDFFGDYGNLSHGGNSLSRKTSVTTADFGFLCVALFVAYVVGKSGQQAPEAENGEGEDVTEAGTEEGTEATV